MFNYLAGLTMFENIFIYNIYLFINIFIKYIKELPHSRQGVLAKMVTSKTL